MLGNLKDFISVVQDGLTTNNNLRQTLSEVQKVFKDKPRYPSESKVNYAAGAELLEKYQCEWAELHNNADTNAKLADETNKKILKIHKAASNQLTSASALAENLAHIPDLTASLAQCIESMNTIQELIKQVEDDLVIFEDIVERSKMEQWKLDHHFHLSLYKEKKLAALEEVRSQMAKENIERSCEREKQQLAELQMRREKSAAAFQNDVSKYLTTGSVPSSSSSGPKLTLDQVQLDEDQTDLEKFLDT